MEITFKYQGKLITTPNLEKKLKRMKLTIDDIEIIDDIKKNLKEEKEEFVSDSKLLIEVKGPNKMIYCGWYSSKPSLEEFFKKIKWNPETKTGLKEVTDEFIKECSF